jgi:hypothetical protein
MPYLQALEKKNLHYRRKPLQIFDLGQKTAFLAQFLYRQTRIKKSTVF